MKVIYALLAFTFASFTSVQAQTTIKEDSAYVQTINGRADKIVANLGLKNQEKAQRVRDMIAWQYRNLNTLHTLRDEKIKAIKAQHAADKTQATEKADLAQYQVGEVINQLHAAYLQQLASELNTTQIEQVKDGMTYGVVPITYKGYQDMIPNLTADQKKQIKAWLIEAREHAMDAESSDKKHGWFGKYKGRINNYLSAQGYDLKKASEDWAKRVKEEEARKKSNKQPTK